MLKRLLRSRRRDEAALGEAESNQLGQLGVLPFTRQFRPDAERLAAKSEVAIWIENGEPRSVVFIRGGQ